MYYDLNMRNAETELGIMIGNKEYWGKGYGTDIVKTLLKHLFEDLKLERVYLHTLAWNYRAQSSFSKSGILVILAVWRGFHDILLMEVNRNSWEEEAT